MLMGASICPLLKVSKVGWTAELLFAQQLTLVALRCSNRLCVWSQHKEALVHTLLGDHTISNALSVAADA